MKTFEYQPLEFGTGLKAVGVFNDLVTLYAGVLDFIEKYGSQIETLEKHLSEKDCERLYYAMAIVPKMITDLAPAVQKELSIEEGPE